MILLWRIVWEASSADAVIVILGSRCSFPKLVLVIEKSRDNQSFSELGGGSFRARATAIARNNCRLKRRVGTVHPF